MTKPQEAPTEIIDVDSSSKRRKLRSGVWEKFKKVTTEKGEQFAYCNQCNKRFTGSRSSGTTHLKRHLERYPRRTIVDVSQQILSATMNTQDKSLIIKNFKFDQVRSRFDLARPILKHEYPFNIVEHEFFRIFLKNLQLMFNVVTKNTIKTDIMEIYRVEREGLYSQLENNSSRISLTTDMWTSANNDGYLCLTAHYLDNEWKLNKKIINFVKICASPNAETLCKVITKCLLDWNIDKKISTITVDNCSTNDSMVTKLKDWIGRDENLIVNSDFFHVRCCAHILNIIVQDGLSVIKHVLAKVRESVKYVDGSPSRKLKWEATMSQLKLKTSKGICQDVCTQWNSTFLMLESALEHKDVFLRLEQADDGYKAAPTKEEWATAKIICDILKNFYNASKLFSGTQYSTANQYFPEVVDIHLKLIGWCDNDNKIVKVMATKMKLKFDKYWSICNLVLAISVFLDHRFKLKLVEYYYFLIYGFDSNPHIIRIHDSLYEVYSLYASNSPASCDLDCNVGSDASYVGSSIQEKLKGFDNWCKNGSYNVQSKKSELDLYLEEPNFLRVPNFDILGWWKANAPKYPCLSKMARDVLMIPVSTVASESAFSTSGRVLNQYRTSMLPETVEALICGQDWIKPEPASSSQGQKASDESKGKFPLPTV